MVRELISHLRHSSAVLKIGRCPVCKQTREPLLLILSVLVLVPVLVLLLPLLLLLLLLLLLRWQLHDKISQVPPLAEEGLHLNWLLELRCMVIV